MRIATSLLSAGMLMASMSFARPGDLTVANSKLTLYGGIGTAYTYASDLRDKDYFDVSGFALGLMKAPDTSSKVGFNLALAQFPIPSVWRGDNIVSIFGDDVQLWLGYFTLAPAKRWTIDAGLLWHKFGEAPVSVLNAHVARPIAIIAQPVAMAGARANYDAGKTKLYFGMNDGSAIGFGRDGRNKRAFEAGASAQLGSLTLAGNYFDHNVGNNLINASLALNLGKIDLKVEADLVSVDSTLAKNDNAKVISLTGKANLGKLKLPVRFEIADDNASGLYAGLKANSLVITPTVNPTPNSFVRAEMVYTKNDVKVFKNGASDTRTSFIVEFGFLF